MESVITAILTDEATRTPEAAESVAAQRVNDTLSPWLNQAAE
jgi:hypothetical protein